jgi:nucleotide-binding universal stress UspA family protein
MLTMKNIAVGIDFTDAREPVLEAGAELAISLGAQLHLIHVIAPEPTFMGYAAYTYPGIDERSEELEQEKAEIQNMVDRLRLEDVDAYGYMRPGETVKTLLEFAEDREAGLIVVGTHSRNLLSRILMGSTAEGVVRHSKIPVVVVPVPTHD